MSGRDDASTLRDSSTVPLMGAERAGAGGAGDGAADGAADERADEPPRKRSRPPAADDASALRRRVLEHKLLRLRGLRERVTEQLSELYFLQAGGNMMDYAAWRKRPPTPSLLAFLEARRPTGAAPAATPAPPEVVDKARQEAHVAARVAELARAGLWAERRLPRVLEPPRAKTHWDYLLEEMAWLAQDFAHERKWKKQAAKKCARAVQKYFQDKAVAAQKAEKAQELQLKKIAAFAAKEIRLFWSNVEKLVEWKRVRRVERARKEALDEQLSYIVDRTERYSRQLAANLVAPRAPPSDDEFEPRGASDDDEETIAAAERDAPDDRDELEALRRESGLELGDLLPPGYVPAHSPPPSDEPAGGSGASSATDASSCSEPESDSESAGGGSSGSERLEALVGTGEEGSQRVEAAASLAATLQPTGTTLSDTEVGTPVPRLLRHALREYQHVGLHWLATMHARCLNGILADEMGLGKTIQTIALLAHLALELRDWGPHLVVAPTSVVLNWEIEFKKWCPAFKILTYYGTIKERKLKRVGWTKANSFHVCITSYKLVVQDHQSFRRKKWKYLILDEAQNIKNFKSQRWQLLLNFQTERRLLLTGTPLQNSLLELWSLMHFLMPGEFASHAQFREWFAPVAGLAAPGVGLASPLAGLADGAARPDALVRRLHEVLRPFLLRRLKADVERQMPRKYEHVLLCRLSKRQRCLYDDFMARAKTKESLASGNLLSVINVLMQLRKVCNHPDLFEPRPVASPLQLPALQCRVPARALLAAVARRVELAARLGGDLASLETAGAGAFAAHRARHLAPPRRLVEEVPDAPRAPPPRPPPCALRLHLRLVPRVPAAGPAPAPPLPAPPARAARPPPAVRAALPQAGAGARLEAHRRACSRRAAALNERRCWRLPLWGADLRAAVHAGPPLVPPRPLAAVLDEMHDIIDRFGVCWSACRAACPQLVVGAGGGARDWRRRALRAERAVRTGARAALQLLHAAASRHAVAFPHPRLLQYDCGKLQTLDALLRRLKAGGHRVLIFTQMTRVLDVLEAFLCMHGHAYLRLDGATRVDARQPLVERFNADARVFAFILSTRSGGVGLNLTGADCVVFYDSDWNPTMDAQAQDRCHRIGQTRDVHVFRLVTAATVEENILRKAEQKRALGHLAIEDGHFTTSYLRAANIEELFGAEGAAGAAGVAEGGELESALAAAEDEADAAAAQAARAEAQGDLAEFDETLPLDDEAAAPPAPAPADEFAALMNQLTPVERYAMRLVEGSETATEAERAALDDMRRQLREWEEARRALRDEPARAAPPAAAAPPDLTYCRDDARLQVWVSGGGDAMPVWGPPTPPSADGDVYCDSWARALYRRGAAPDALLPPCRWREARAARSPRRARPAPRPAHAPPSLFERAGGARPRPRPRVPPAPRDPPAPPPDWAPAEDAALRRALRLQRLPAEPPAAHLPNWDWLAELVADAARAYRSPRACRERHDALADPERARRKHRKPAPARRRPDDDAPRPPLPRLDAMREAAERRRGAPKRRLDDAAHRNPKHAALLADHGIDYEAPPTPMDVATRRAERIAKEKLKAGAATAPPAVAPLAGSPSVPAAPAQRVVVAATGAAAEAARRARAVSEAPRGAAPTAQLLYRQQTLAARHHLKILQHAAPQSGGEVGPGGAALRTLHLQQLALRRARPAGPPPHPLPAHGAASHVVLAHLAQHAPAPAAPHAPHPPPHAPDAQQ